MFKLPQWSSVTGCGFCTNPPAVPPEDLVGGVRQTASCALPQVWLQESPYWCADNRIKAGAIAHGPFMLSCRREARSFIVCFTIWIQSGNVHSWVRQGPLFVGLHNDVTLADRSRWVRFPEDILSLVTVVEHGALHILASQALYHRAMSSVLRERFLMWHLCFGLSRPSHPALRLAIMSWERGIIYVWEMITSRTYPCL